MHGKIRDLHSSNSLISSGQTTKIPKYSASTLSSHCHHTTKYGRQSFRTPAILSQASNFTSFDVRTIWWRSLLHTLAITRKRSRDKGEFALRKGDGLEVREKKQVLHKNVSSEVMIGMRRCPPPRTTALHQLHIRAPDLTILRLTRWCFCSFVAPVAWCTRRPLRSERKPGFRGLFDLPTRLCLSRHRGGVSSLWRLLCRRGCRDLIS